MAVKSGLGRYWLSYPRCHPFYGPYLTLHSAIHRRCLSAAAGGKIGLFAQRRPDRPMPPKPRHIIHADLDAFYAAVEQLDNPELRGLLMAVGADQRPSDPHPFPAAIPLDISRTSVP